MSYSRTVELGENCCLIWQFVAIFSSCHVKLKPQFGFSYLAILAAFQILQKNMFKTGSKRVLNGFRNYFKPVLKNVQEFKKIWLVENCNVTYLKLVWNLVKLGQNSLAGLELVQNRFRTRLHSFRTS